MGISALVSLCPVTIMRWRAASDDGFGPLLMHLYWQSLGYAFINFSFELNDGLASSSFSGPWP